MIYYESDYEEALIELLVNEGWTYKPRKEIIRKNTEVLLVNVLKDYLKKQYQNLEDDNIDEIINILRHVEGQTHFDRLRNTYCLVRDGFRYERSEDGYTCDIKFINFNESDANIFTCVNQFEVGYGKEGYKRIPDVLLFINGIPLCIFELKNPIDSNATILNAYKQIHIRYMRDIPHLLRYCPLSCISDAAENATRLGTTYTPYEHYYVWKKINNEDDSATGGVEQVKTIVKGVYEPKRFLEILRDYIYFPDETYDKEEEIVCRYPQFFATRKLRESVRSAFNNESSKGGTYFGATGCGKTYTMMFLARQLSLRCPELGSPTIVMIVDRDDLQTQAGKLFLRSEMFLSLGAAKIIGSRQELKQEMSLRKSGGFFICTIQKFCEEIGLLNERRNIICFSDEAHRTQIRVGSQLKIKDNSDTKKNSSDQLGAFVTKPYAEHLRVAFPHATFVGFTGTPISETIQVFGDIVDSYTMQQAVEDDITKDIKYIPRIAEVTLDNEKVKAIDAYYKKCEKEDATKEDVIASKKAMSAMEVILGDDDRLERLASDIVNHYVQACGNKENVVQKAMIVCSTREIAYNLLMKIKKIKPSWFQNADSPYYTQLEKTEHLKKTEKVPAIAMIATRGKDDPKEMYDYLGDKNHRKEMADYFKNEYSNFRIAVVVDMWITGFDVPCLTYLYNDKPLKKHTLIQTISRVNRKYPGKEFGYIIDYIGIRNNMMQAINTYGGGNHGPSVDDVEHAKQILCEELEIIKRFFTGFDLTPFIDKKIKPLQRLEKLGEAVDFILSMSSILKLEQKEKNKPDSVSPKKYFLSHVKRLRLAYDICQPSNVLKYEELSLSQCYMAVASYLRKTSGEQHDTESMNRAVRRMVEDALKCNKVVSILQTDVEEDIFSPEFQNQLNCIKMPSTRLEVLVKMIKQSISEYKKTNRFEASKYEDLLKETIKQYHERRALLSAENASETQKETVSSIIDEATKQALDILNNLGKSKESFRGLGLTFEEKAFYDILIHLRDKYNFEYGEDKKVNDLIVNNKCKELAKKIKALIDEQSSFADWLNNENVRSDLYVKVYLCLDENGYPPTYNQEVFNNVMEQVENFKQYK